MASNLALAAALGSFSLGLIHSLIPSHWLPVVVLAKSRRWSMSTVTLAALAAASGHILVSVVVGILLIVVGAAVFARHLEAIEHVSSLFLVAFGVIYAVVAWNRHSACHGHSHHGESLPPGKSTVVFLISLGLVPCATVIPTFVTAAASGKMVLVLALIGFAIGVITAVVAATLLALRGVADLDHPWVEHYGDVMTGVAAAALGLVFWLFHEQIHPH